MNSATSVGILPPPLPSASPSRSVLVTALAWVAMVIGALLVPVSFISLLMILAGSHGTQEATWSGGLLVIGGPPALAAVGFGLWRRWRWAHIGAIALLVALIIGSIVTLARGSRPEQTYISPTGVRTTVSGSEVDVTYHVTVMVVAGGLIALLLSRRIRSEFWIAARVVPVASTPAADRVAPAADAPRRFAATGATSSGATARGWRVGHQGRDLMYYEEWRDGGWQRLELSGEMLMGPAHHAIYFASPEAWRQFPAWARDRRDEIIARIKSEFRAPDYEYYGDTNSATTPAPAATVEVATASLRPVAPDFSPQRAGTNSATPAQKRALLLMIVLMLGVAAATGWLAGRGIVRGETWFPSKRPSQQRAIERAHEPALFWVSTGIYGAISLGALGFAAWLAREGVRLRERAQASRFSSASIL